MMENSKMVIEKAEVQFPFLSFIISKLGFWIHEFFHSIFTLLFIIYLGIFYLPDGDKYEGEWKNDKKEGKGTISISNYSLFLNLDYGYIHFFHYIFPLLFIIYLGIFYYVSGSKYDGEFKNGNREGRGTISIPKFLLFLNLDSGYMNFFILFSLYFLLFI